MFVDFRFKHFMKHKASVIPDPDVKSLASRTIFNVGEVKKLFMRFCSLADSSGLVRLQPFLSQPEVSTCRMAKIAYKYESSRRNEILKESLQEQPPGGMVSETNDLGTTGPHEEEGIDFEGFVNIFNEFSTKREFKDKTLFLFPPKVQGR